MSVIEVKTLEYSNSERLQIKKNQGSNEMGLFYHLNRFILKNPDPYFVENKFFFFVFKSMSPPHPLVDDAGHLKHRRQLKDDFSTLRGFLNFVYRMRLKPTTFRP